MSWVTWRQHRLEGVWSLVLVAALAAAIGFVAYQLHIANCSGGIGVGYCFDNRVGGQIAQLIGQYNLYTYALVVLPALAGAFIGCPLVAREIENGTHRLAWTQGVTRLRWLATKLILVLVPVVLAGAAVGFLEVLLLDQMGSQANHWAVFDQQAPMTAASTLFALSLGVAVGAVLGRSIPAMAVTLVVFVVVRIGIAVVARPHFEPPMAYVTHDMSTFSVPPAGYPTAWWIDEPSYYNSAGQLMSNGGRGYGPQTAYAVQHFQPGDRFWAFQSIESAILSGLSVVLIWLAIYWVTRRVS